VLIPPDVIGEGLKSFGLRKPRLGWLPDKWVQIGISCFLLATSNFYYAWQSWEVVRPLLKEVLHASLRQPLLARQSDCLELLKSRTVTVILAGLVFS